MNQEQEPPGPGVVVLSPSLQVLHMNRQAMVLLNQLEHTVQSVGAERAFSAPLHQPCRDITETLQARMRSNNWEQFQLCRTIGDSPHRIVLKGFGIPHRRGLSHSRIVMLLFPHIGTVDAGNQQKGILRWDLRARLLECGLAATCDRHVTGCWTILSTPQTIAREASFVSCARDKHDVRDRRDSKFEVMSSGF